MTMSEGHRHEALGDVARDVLDHITMIARDETKIARLSAKRVATHLREDVAPKALYAAGAGVCAALAGLFALIALFWGIAVALGSAAWAFVIYAVLFALAAVVLAGYMRRAAELHPSEAIERRFPATRAVETKREHALARLSTPEAHREVTSEAEREASRDLLSAVHRAENEVRRTGWNGEARRAGSNGEARRVEIWEISSHDHGQQVPIERTTYRSR
ncbi:Hypothetical protein A7982_09164 [Minicystis rosea]|nr:Hypothetical protein A7982_09164 [Minicystis rosea]